MSQTRKTSKKRVAVFFGGRSPEHDVSVVSGLQALQAIDQSRFDAFPVYIAPDGAWLVGDVLRERANYLLDKNALKQAVSVFLDIKPQNDLERKGVLLARTPSLLGPRKVETFDVALPVFHGLFGEDGNIQGLFELAGIPYGGMRTLASAVLMDKGVTKYAQQAKNIPYLPYAILRRPEQGTLIPKSQLEVLVKDIGFPCIVKPVHLGSSIGVARAETVDELGASLPAIFEFDDAAIVEPFVKNLVEYNVAVSRIGGDVRTSAIERPKTKDQLLDFKQKYLSGGDNKSGTKTPGQISEGMLSLTRELNPQLDPASEKNIRAWAVAIFESLGGTGAPRIDFIGDAKSGEIWLNEVNPCPGSLGYFLWEAAADPVLFTDLLSGLIEEALAERRKRVLPADPVPRDARLFKRPV
jgi:D-alanine-D-alanine ligase